MMKWMFACAIAGAVAIAGSVRADGQQLTVPNLIGKTPDEASKLVKAAGFSGDPESSRPIDCKDPPKVADGHINCQDPPPGTKVSRYSIVQIAVYETPVRHEITKDEVHSLYGKPVAEVKKALADWGYHGQISQQSAGTGNAHCTAGQVCEIMPSSGFTLSAPISLSVAEELKIGGPPP